jgi:RES domain-containing protein
MVEYFVHLDMDDPPRDLVVVSAEIPDAVSRVAYTRPPKNWRGNPPPPEFATVGDAFVREDRAAVLIVPSAIAPSESNWLINPLHTEFARIRISRPEPCGYDARFFRRPN